MTILAVGGFALQIRNIYLENILLFLRGILQKARCRTWFFAGEFVVDSW
jgi:hypothetical protein